MRRFLILTFLILALTVAWSKFTRKNIDSIENEMIYEEVVDILGEPTDSSSAGFGPFSASSAEWEGTDGSISIQFVNDKVQAKSFQSQRSKESG
jgi:hypothetical protein